jgi:ATP-dependent RNA helicase RhlE
LKFDQFSLDPRLQPGIERARYEAATPIQEAAIPAALRGRDLIGTAQTGTGKTAAFVLPILHRLLNGQRNQTRALIVTPTRELAEQIHQVIRVLSAQTGLRSATVYGGVGQTPQVKALQAGIEIIVACPGRLLDLLDQRHARLDKVEVLVLDEADRMLDMGFLPDVRRIIKAVPENRQTMLFSATFPVEVEGLAAQALKHPQRIAMGIARPAHTVAHALYPVPAHLKTGLLLELIKRTETDPVLVFTCAPSLDKLASCDWTQGTADEPTAIGRKGQRQAALTASSAATTGALVAATRRQRLDVESISHVINFDMPDSADAYIHRIGRTGRAQRKGDAFTLVTPDDNAMIRTLERILGGPMRRETMDGFNYTAPAPPRTAGSRRDENRRPARPPATPGRYITALPAQEVGACTGAGSALARAV